MELEKLGFGLCDYDASNPENKSKPTFLSYPMLQITVDSEQLLSPQQVERYKETMMLLTKIGQPRSQCFRKTLDENDIINFHFTSTNEKISNDIWEKNVDAIRCREIHQSQKATSKLYTTHAPASLKQRHHDVRLFVDVVCINDLPLKKTISKVLTLRTIARMPNREK